MHTYLVGGGNHSITEYSSEALLLISLEGKCINRDVQIEKQSRKMGSVIKPVPAEVGVLQSSDGVQVGVVGVFACLQESLLPVDVLVVPVEILDHAARVNL